MIPIPCAHRPRTPGALPTAFPQVAQCCCFKLSKDGAAEFPEQCPTQALLTVQGEHRACPEATEAPGGTLGGMLHHYYCCPSFLSKAPLAVSKGRSICGTMVTHLHLTHQLPSNLRGTEHLPKSPGPCVRRPAILGQQTCKPASGPGWAETFL